MVSTAALGDVDRPVLMAEQPPHLNGPMRLNRGLRGGLEKLVANGYIFANMLRLIAAGR